MANVDPADVAVFIMPGGDRWQEAPIEPELAALVRTLDAQDVTIAAICATTVAIGRLGLLRNRRHTSNALGYLTKYDAGLCGGGILRGRTNGAGQEADHRQRSCRREFARELFEELDVLPAAARALWAQIFRGGRVREPAA